MSKQGYKDENSTQDRLTEKKTAAANEVERNEQLRGSKAGRARDEKATALRPASRAKKLEDSVNANSRKTSCK